MAMYIGKCWYCETRGIMMETMEVLCIFKNAIMLRLLPFHFVGIGSYYKSPKYDISSENVMHVFTPPKFSSFILLVKSSP